MKIFEKRIMRVLELINLILITFTVVNISIKYAYEDQKILEPVSITITKNTVINSAKCIDNYDKINYVYTEDYMESYKGSCGPVAIANMLAYYQQETSNIILTDGEVTKEQFIKIAKNAKTDPNGGTVVKNVSYGIEKSYEDFGIDVKVSQVNFDLWNTIKREINSNRTLFLACKEDDFIHAYVIIGYADIENGQKAVITYTGWKDSPYRVIGINQNQQIYFKVKY